MIASPPVEVKESAEYFRCHNANKNTLMVLCKHKVARGDEVCMKMHGRLFACQIARRIKEG